MTQVQDIKETLDIVDVVSSYVKLKRSGKNYFGLCPFHNEKTPSFSVNPELGIYKCFGCGEAGDVIKFIEKIENVSFQEALKIAAKRAGIELRSDFHHDDKYSKERKKLINLNTFVAQFYNFVLTKHKAGLRGRRYLKSRELEGDLVEKFQIGYAPKGYENLKRILINRGYKEDELARYGFLAARGGRTYDKFRERVMFPIQNEYGEIVGFSGRTIVADFKGPKYLNSPQTQVYKKRRLLYGMMHAKEKIREYGFIIITEGQIDVLSAHKTKYNNVVAPLGTSLTGEQLQIVKRYTNKVYFCFDSDYAGEKAAFNAFSLASKMGFDIFGINLGEFGDVDEMIRSDPKKWKSAVLNASDMVTYLIFRLSNRINIRSLEGKLEVARLIIPIIRRTEDEIKKDFYIKELARKIEVDVDVLYKELAKSRDQRKLKGQTYERKHVKDKEEFEREDYLMAILLQYFPKIKHTIKLVEEDLIRKKDNQKILNAMKKYILNVKDTSITAFIASLPDSLQKDVKDKILLKLPDLNDTNKRIAEIQSVQMVIKNDIKKERMDELRQEIKRAEDIGDETKLELLQKQLQETLDR